MKKNGLDVVVTSMVLVIGFFLTGCASAPPPDLGIYNNATEDQLCILEIAGGLKVIEFNGERVSWAENGIGTGEASLSSNAWRAQKAGSDYKTIIRIPAGEHSLKANLYLWEHNRHPGYNVSGITAGYVWVDGLEISYNFLPGHTYSLRPVITGNDAARRDVEIIKYVGTGGIFIDERGGRRGISIPAVRNFSVRLRLDEDGNPISNGPVVTR